MLKSLVSVTEQHYPQVVRWITLAIGGIGLISLGVSSPSLAAIWTIGLALVLCICTYLLVDRYYVAVVFALCLALNILIAFVSSYLYAINSSNTFSFTALGIILAGLLLGGLGATITAAVTLLVLVLGEAAMLNHLFPVPSGVVPPNSSSVIIGGFDNFILIVLIYLSVVFFAYVIRQALAALNQQRSQLASALAQVEEKQTIERQTGNTIVEVMMHLGSIAREQLSSVQEQVAALAEVSTTVEELSQTAIEIASTAHEVEDAAQQALVAVGTSQGAVNDSLQATMLIKLQVQQIVERIIALNERIASISEVTTVVSNIAAKTHLLALNAAIEAAGAGEAGGRFATVASEVKKLAQQSQNEAARINDLVAEVQRANTASVMATEQGLKDADKGAAEARKSAEANLEVIDLVEATSSRARSITMSTQQQRSASEQVVETMRHLRIAAQGIADTATSINGTISELSALASQLGTLISGQLG